MRQRLRLSSAIARVTSPLVVILLGSSTVSAQAASAPSPVDAYDRWKVALSIPIWIPGVSGTLASGGNSIDFDRPANPVGSNGSSAVTELEFAFLGRVDSRVDRWIGYGDLFTLTLEKSADFQTEGVDAKGSTTATAARLLGGYRVIEGAHQPSSTSFDVDLLAGARYYYVGAELTEPAALAFDVSKSWADPLIGTRLTMDFPGPFDVWLLADIGGFGVGSELSWSATVAARWQFSRHFALELGYTALSVDYSIRGGDFEYQLDLFGPQLAISYIF